MFHTSMAGRDGAGTVVFGHKLAEGLRCWRPQDGRELVAASGAERLGLARVMCEVVGLIPAREKHPPFL
jgi:hypothetical protein